MGNLNFPAFRSRGLFSLLFLQAVILVHNTTCRLARIFIASDHCEAGDTTDTEVTLVNNHILTHSVKSLQHHLRVGRTGVSSEA